MSAADDVARTKEHVSNIKRAIFLLVTELSEPFVTSILGSLLQLFSVLEAL
jgi:hypothetical protein